jgi:hypothetical protein
VTTRVRQGLTIVLAVLVPLAVATAWIPVRSRLANTDLALILVLTVALLGVTGSRTVVAVSAVSGALWFEFFDTVPFQRLAIDRRPDLETTVMLGVVAFVAGELAVRAVRHRATARAELAMLHGVGHAAMLLATGEELVQVVRSVADRLADMLALADCSFEAATPRPGRREIGRDGSLGASANGGPGIGSASANEIELPIWGQGQLLGHFVLSLRDGQVPGRENLLVAVTLADQVGAAFMAQAPPPPETPGPDPVLRVVR